MNIDIFLNQILLESIDCLFEFTQIIMPLLKDLMPDKYYLEKSIIKNYNIIINGKNFYDQAIGSHIKWYKEIKKLTKGQHEDYTKGCLLDYGYVKNHYRLISLDLSRQKELYHDPKAIQQI